MKKMHIVIAVIVIIIVMIISSFSKYEELNNLSIISNISISYKDGNYIVTMQEIIPSMENNKISYKYEYRTGSSKNMKKAFSSITNHSPKKIYLKKVQNIIIENNNKDKILKDFIKYQIKNKNINKDASIITTDSTLKKIIKVNSDYKYIDSILKDKRTSLKTITKYYKKNKRIKLPLLNIKNHELAFKKYVYSQV